MQVGGNNTAALYSHLVSSDPIGTSRALENMMYKSQITSVQFPFSLSHFLWISRSECYKNWMLEIQDSRVLFVTHNVQDNDSEIQLWSVQNMQ